MLTLADAILEENLAAVHALISTTELNKIDEYGFTPLIEAAIVDNIEISRLLLKAGAHPNFTDVTGSTALHWAAENNNKELAALLIEYHANPNAYNFAGQPVLVMPLLRQQHAIKKFLIKAGANLIFAQDYINSKLLGHLFELIGTAAIVTPQNDFVEVDFEGFYLEVTLGLIADSLAQFQNHFAARQLRRYSGLSSFIVEVIQRAAMLIKFQQYRVDVEKHQASIEKLLSQEPLIIPVGYEGHAITFIKSHDIWVKCDRREDSRLYDNIMFYKITQPNACSMNFLKSLIYEKQSSHFINTNLDRILGLQPLTELKVEAQMSGNCSWANVEATIPALFFLILMQSQQASPEMAYYKTLSLNYFHRWQSWSKERALHYCLTSFQESDSLRKASKAEILGAILFQRGNQSTMERAQVAAILNALMGSPYEYIIKNYLRIYFQESYTEEGKRFAALLKEFGYSMG